MLAPEKYQKAISQVYKTVKIFKTYQLILLSMVRLRLKI